SRDRLDGPNHSFCFVFTRLHLLPNTSTYVFETLKHALQNDVTQQAQKIKKSHPNKPQKCT
ncbi:hypothetical protein NL463_28235, partial [Klebsiella pneumoniae]|nr:hypothetical protein [Klebsiella pneumoniae]